MAFDILIKNGTVIDGIKNEGYQADVAVSKDKIKAVGNLAKAKADLVIDATGQYVTPGFIDIQNHSDSYLTLLEIPSQESLVRQGITSIVVGHCGTSLAPLPEPGALKSVQKWHSLVGANVDWLSFPEYLLSLEKYEFGVNVASLVGHATIRRGIIGDSARAAAPEEIKIISKIFEESLDAGGGGASLGLMYAHEVDSSQEELEAVARLASAREKILSVHLRSDSSHVVDAVNEAITLSASCKARAKISHLKIRGRENWRYLDQLLGLLDRAYQQGTDIFFDVYPYTTSWAVLYTYLPKWAYQGGKKAILQNLRSETSRKNILAYLREQEHNLENILIASSETNPGLVGKTLKEIARNNEVKVEEALLNVLAATNAQTVVFDHNLSPEVTETLLKHPLSVVASDGAGYDFSNIRGRGLPHPRCFGTFPKFLSMVREKKIMSWGEAIKKITLRPAEKIGLANRGKISPGASGDVVIFDPKTIGSDSTYENPYREPDGINHVLVNGKIAYTASAIASSLSGRVIRL